MTHLRHPLKLDPFLIAIALTIAFILWFNLGCATCEPTIIKEPVEVLVPVPVPPVPLLVPPLPEYEQCNQEAVAARVACVGRNVVKLREYARVLLDEIEAHNHATTGP